MLTGDNPITAHAIAERIGMPDGPILTGDDVRDMDEAALADALARLLKEPELRRRLAIGAAAARAALPDWEQAGARFAAEIHRIITP